MPIFSMNIRNNLDERYTLFQIVPSKMLVQSKYNSNHSHNLTPNPHPQLQKTTKSELLLQPQKTNTPKSPSTKSPYSQPQLIIDYNVYSNKFNKLVIKISVQMDGEGLFKVEDINSIIRLFAFKIQQRFDEIDGITSTNNTDVSHYRYFSQDQPDDSERLVRKYRNYLTNNDKQIKYLQKFVIRITQIIDFFKQKSKNQQLLSYTLKKINDKLTKIVHTIPIDVQWLFFYVIDLSKNGFTLKKIDLKTRKQSQKKVNTQPQKSTQPNPDHKKQTNSQQCRHLRVTIATADQARRKRSFSINTKCQPKIPLKQPTNTNVQTQIAKIYSGLDVDYTHLQKIISSKNKIKLQKDCIKSNASVLTSIQVYDKMYSYSSIKKKQKIDLMLKQVHNRPIQRPLSNNWISRKKKIQCRKKKIDENLSFL